MWKAVKAEINNKTTLTVGVFISKGRTRIIFSEKLSKFEHFYHDLEDWNLLFTTIPQSLLFDFIQRSVRTSNIKTKPLFKIQQNNGSRSRFLEIVVKRISIFNIVMGSIMNKFFLILLVWISTISGETVSLLSRPLHDAKSPLEETNRRPRE